MNRLIKVVVALVGVLALTAPVAAAQAPITLEFEKTGGAGFFEGPIEGGGTFQMTVTKFDVRGNTGHITATLRLIDTTEGTLTAEVRGQLNFRTGRGVLNGVVVTDGAYEGARVHEESQLVYVDPVTLEETYVGTIRIMPAS